MFLQKLYLLRLLAWHEFKTRYVGSILGYVWSLLKPFLLFLILYSVFSGFGNFEMKNYALYLLLGIILWNFFAEATNASLNSLVAKSGLIKKIYFPRIFVVLASVFSAFLTLFINLGIYLIIFKFTGAIFDKSIIYFVGGILMLVMFTMSIGLVLSLLQAKFRDTVQIWEVFLSAGFFITPIFYPLEAVASRFQYLVAYNPIGYFMNFSRYSLFDDIKIEFEFLILYLVGLVLFLILSLFLFRLFEPYVIEEI